MAPCPRLPRHASRDSPRHAEAAEALVVFVALAILATALPVGTLPLLDDLRSAVGGSPPQDARGAVLKAFATQGSLPVAPGVTHDWGAAGTNGGPQAVHFVNIAGDASLISFEAAMSNDAIVGLERTTSMANRQSGEGHRAIAAINGDVWSAQSRARWPPRSGSTSARASS